MPCVPHSLKPPTVRSVCEMQPIKKQTDMPGRGRIDDRKKTDAGSNEPAHSTANDLLLLVYSRIFASSLFNVSTLPS